ncbi:hypothetical protein [Propionibacterium phage TCUCAP1]|nr:hypothetical protein [Propionibacterium phage TCUCAP1]
MGGAGCVHPCDDAALDPCQCGEEGFVAVQLNVVVGCVHDCSSIVRLMVL